MSCRGQIKLCIAFKKVFPTHFLTIKTTCKPNKLREKEMKPINLPRQTFIVQKPGTLVTVGSYSTEEKAPVLGLQEPWSFFDRALVS